MRCFSLIALVMFSAAAVQAQGAQTWSGSMTQGQIEAYIDSSDGGATLAVSCTPSDGNQKNGLTIFVGQERPKGEVSVRVDGADAMTFVSDQGEFGESDANRDALFNAMISGAEAEVVLADGKAFTFSLSGSSKYLKPCL